MSERNAIGTLPYTPEELLLLGQLFALLSGIPVNLRDDIAQEFAIAGWCAVAQAEHDENIQAFQMKAGRWAARDFLRKEKRRRIREERYMSMKLGNAGNLGKGGDNCPELWDADPARILATRELAVRAMVLLEKLPEMEQTIVTGIVLEDRTQQEIAAQYHLSQAAVSMFLKNIFKKIRKKC